MLLLAGLALSAPAAELYGKPLRGLTPVSIAELNRKAAGYDGKTIQVRGTVRSEDGAFLLAEGAASLRVTMSEPGAALPSDATGASGHGRRGLSRERGRRRAGARGDGPRADALTFPRSGHCATPCLRGRSAAGLSSNSPKVRKLHVSMRLGVDFGTTHTVVTMVDRGNYPVVAFEGGDPYPSLAALLPSGELRYGFDAVAVRHEPGVRLVRSFKRLLADAGPRASVEIGGCPVLLLDLLTGFLSQVKEDLLTRSNASVAEGEPLEVAISVPANSSSAQRFLTLEAFRAAGFTPVALLNEPSAAGFEYAHRFRSTITSRRENVLVYDLGGGTFDASLLRMTGKTNEVVTSEGVRRLGGDDFDEAILAAVLARAGRGRARTPTRATSSSRSARGRRKRSGRTPASSSSTCRLSTSRRSPSRSRTSGRPARPSSNGRSRRPIRSFGRERSRRESWRASTSSVGRGPSRSSAGGSASGSGRRG